jgi:hypothetical protein
MTRFRKPLARVVVELHLEPRFFGLRWRRSACDFSIARLLRL